MSLNISHPMPRNMSEERIYVLDREAGLKSLTVTAISQQNAGLILQNS